MNTPQPHADDVKLAEEILRQVDTWPAISGPRFLFQESIDELASDFIDKVTTPLRLSNETLRERVKELANEVNSQIHDTAKWRELAERSHTRDICRQLDSMESKLTAASEVIEKCERAMGILKSEVESYHIDWARISPQSFDYDKDYKPKFPPCVEQTQQALAAIKLFKENK